MQPYCCLRHDRFSEAIRAGRISKVEKISECCILAAVGQQMASRKGVAATMFSALAKANINIRCAALSVTFCLELWVSHREGSGLSRGHHTCICEHPHETLETVPIIVRWRCGRS